VSAFLKKIFHLLLIAAFLSGPLAWASESPGDGEDSKDNCKASNDPSRGTIKIGSSDPAPSSQNGGADSGTTCPICPGKDEEDNNDAKDPVSLLGGKLNMPFFDLKLNGIGRKTGLAYLYVRRSFSSQTSIVGAFGYNWASNLDVHLTENWMQITSGGVQIGTTHELDWLTGVTIRTESGNLIYFKYDSEKEAYVSPACEDSLLYRNRSGYTWKKKYGTSYVFEKVGDRARFRLSRVVDRFGNKILYIYDDNFAQDHYREDGSQVFYLPRKLLEAKTGRYIDITWKDYSSETGDSPVNFYVSKIRDSSGREVRYEYRATAGMIGLTLWRITDFENNTVQYDFFKDSVQLASGNENDYRTLQVTNARNAKTTYFFSKRPSQYFDNWSGTEDPGNGTLRVVKAVDALGNEMNFHYDPNLATSILTDKNGNKKAVMYSHGQVDRIIYANGKSVAYAYDGGYNRTLEERESGMVQKTFDRNHNLVRKIDENGEVTEIEYDADSNLWTKKTLPGDVTYTREVEEGVVLSKSCYAPNSDRFFSQIAINGFPGSGRVIPAKD
jgi:YD repeat-containing protein